jgi:hypothetical protein
LVLLLALTLPACGVDEPASPPGLFFPTVPIGDSYPAALIEGVLEERSGCLFVAAHGDRWLLLWPEGYAARIAEGQIEVVDAAGKLVGRESEQVQLGGGEGNPIEMGGAAEAERWASELTGVDIPERCGDLYWLVSP